MLYVYRFHNEMPLLTLMDTSMLYRYYITLAELRSDYPAAIRSQL